MKFSLPPFSFNSLFTSFVLSAYLLSVSRSTGFFIDNYTFSFNSYYRELALIVLVFFPLLFSSLRNQLYDLNLFLFFLFTSFLSIIGLYFSSSHSLFLLQVFSYLRWLLPFFVFFIYIRCELSVSSLLHFQKVLIFSLILFFIISLQQYIQGACIQNKCPSIFYNGNSLAGNTVLLYFSLLLSQSTNQLKQVVLRVLGLMALAILLLAYSSTAFLVLIVFLIFTVLSPFVLSFRQKVYPKSLTFIIACVLTFIPTLFYFARRNLFDFGSDTYSISLGTRFDIFYSIFNDNFVHFIFGSPGLYTNLYYSFDSQFGYITDSLINSFFGNLGIFGLLFYILIFAYSLYQLTMTINSKFLSYSVSHIWHLSVFCASILGFTSNLFELYPGIIIFSLSLALFHRKSKISFIRLF
tara:strand:+ start:23555 stop:24781 length:1227 start_codon:yes stop_codon:yes gene_type:complete